MVTEARKLGLDDAKILDRLQLVRFMMTPAAYKKFVKALRLDARAAS